MTTFRLLPNGARRRLPDGSVRSLGADGLRYTDVSGTTGVGVLSAGGGATAGIYIVGTSVVLFSLSGNLTQDGFVGSTHLNWNLSGTAVSRLYLYGDSRLSLTTTAVATAGRLLRGEVGVAFTTAGALETTNPIRGYASLTWLASGVMGWRINAKATTRIGFGVGGILSTASARRWREFWLEFYDRRQKLLNAIDAKNRALAIEAGEQVDAVATALDITNTNVSNIDGRLTAESNRTTALTARVTTAEGTLIAQGTAQSSLNTRVTIAEGNISTQSTAITAVTATANGKNKTYSQGTAPSGGLTTGDLWVNTANNNALSRWNGSAWVSASDARIGGIASAVETLDARVDVAEDGVTRAKAIHGVLLNVDGHISGTESINDGTRSVFSIMATVFRIISSGSTGLEWQNGYLRAYSGAIQLILGINFGASSNLCFWYGPNVGAAGCTKTNGTIWFDNTGDAYFGGSLSAGTFKNAVRTSSTAGNAEIINGPFATNGNPKNVVVSYSFVKRDTANTGTWGAPTGTTSATIAIYRKVGGAAESLVTNFNVTGTVERTNEMGGPSLLSCYMDGSYTFTDNTSGTGDFTYRAIITSRSNHVASPSSGTVSVNVAQTLGIISVEQ